MKAYVATTGAVFGLLTAVHLWRLVVEPHFASDPWWYVTTGAALVLCLWAARLLWGARARPR